MSKRLLSCTPGEMLALNKEEFLAAVAGSEGRVLAAETIGTMPPLLGDVTNAELAAALGADLLLLNMLDVNAPVVNGLPDVAPDEVVREVKRLTGRRIGINLEPVDPSLEAVQAEEMWGMTDGRRATVANAEKAAALGVDFIVLTGNPGMGVSNAAIVDSLAKIKAAVGDRVALAAGKMHAAGVPSESGEKILTAADVTAFLEAGADVILLPAPGTVPGLTTEYVRGLIALTHEHNALAMTSIGTSQEGADTATLRTIALQCKMAGADIHHIGDSGYVGMALPENITAYSVAIRGVRHTYHRMAQSINR